MRTVLARSLLFSQAIIATCTIAPLIANAQDAAQPDPIHWGSIEGHLQIGWEPLPAEFRLGEPIILKMHIRMPDKYGKPVHVSVWGTLDFYSVRVFYGANRSVVAMTKQGMIVADPDRYIGAQGGYLDNRVLMVSEIRLSEWWDVSRPGQYTVSIEHRQPLSGQSDKYFTLRAPDVTFRVIGK